MVGLRFGAKILRKGSFWKPEHKDVLYEVTGIYAGQAQAAQPLEPFIVCRSWSKPLADDNHVDNDWGIPRYEKRDSEPLFLLPELKAEAFISLHVSCLILIFRFL